MKIRRRALKKVALVTSAFVAIQIVNVELARADFTVCETGFKNILERKPPPAPLAWRSPGQSKEARVAQAAKVKSLSRLRAQTKIVNVGDANAAEALANLDDGIYVWGVDQNGRIAVLNRNMEPGSEQNVSQFLGSHSGLMRVLQSSPQKEPARFVATGEIVRRNGRTMLVDNASGTYPGRAENLDFGVRKLRAAGLEIDSRTLIQDLSESKVYDPHHAAYVQVPIEIRVGRDPKLRAFHDETKRVMTKVDGKFKDRLELLKAMENVSMTEGWSPYTASYIFERWQNPTEGTAYIVDAIYRQAGSDEKFRALLKALEKTADSVREN